MKLYYKYMYFKLNEQTKEVHWMYSVTIFKKSIYLLLLYLYLDYIHNFRNYILHPQNSW